MSDRAYDVIVIGGGLAGLSCAAHLARAGKKVIVIEQNFKPGGYCTSFSRKGVIFNPAIHWIIEHDKLNNMLTELDVPPVKFTLHNPLFRLIGPCEGTDISISINRNGFIKSIIDTFPSIKKKTLNQLLDLSLDVNKESEQMPKTSPELISSFSRTLMAMQMPFKLGKTLKYSRMPMEGFLESLFPGDDLKCLCLGLRAIIPMADFPAIGMLGILSIALQGLAFEPIDGAQKIADAFAEAVHTNGGEIFYSKKVTEIKVDNRRAVGIKLEDGEEVDADYVVSAIDARQTFEKLIDPGLVPSKYKKGLDAPLSDSYFTVSIITDINPARLGFDCADVFYNSAMDVREMFSNNNPETGSFRITFPPFREEGADPNHYAVQIMAQASIEFENYWKAGPQLRRGKEYNDFKKAFAMRYVKRAEKLVPDLSKHIIFMDVATPITLYRYTLNHRGTALGWRDFAMRKQKVPFIRGLYQAGHWTFPGAFVQSVIFSGKYAAELILKNK